ncbi:ABC transporter ATP-binding protein [Litorimonas sp. WD9-15]|uniref:ABC transporter ATP-binding protein n=1 Tax=Litorimonas sp. WD9-15 TaxID=3418716 RepID=UPI003D062C2F
MPFSAPDIQSRTPILQAKDLTVRYGKHTALDGLSVDIAPGELVGVIGPNGAGKTSFIKALCGRVDVKGQLSVSDTALHRGTDRRRHIALVPQDIGLYAHLTARENLQVMGRLLGLKDKDAIAKALKSVEMTKHANTRVSDMSGGMKRRINVAAAILTDPALVIFDEPTAGIDAPARDTVHRLARTLAKQGKAVILITHELEQAEALCDKVLVLCDGRRLAFEPPARLLERSFQGQREVMVRYATPPASEVMSAMKPFEFKQGELPTVWVAMTDANEVSFVSAFLTALQGQDDLVREISVRRPGLTALMHRIEKTGKLAA